MPEIDGATASDGVIPFDSHGADVDKDSMADDAQVLVVCLTNLDYNTDLLDEAYNVVVAQIDI